jgi:hypothetical protein
VQEKESIMTSKSEQHPPGVFTEYGKDWNAESCGTSVCGTAQETGGITEKVKEAAGYVGEKAEQATHAVGAGMEKLGSAMQPQGGEGVLGGAREAVGTKLEGAGQYLEEQGLKGIGSDLTNLIRQHPVPALLIGAGVGFLLAKLAARR